jgi:hypothetical protein
MATAQTGRSTGADPKASEVRRRNITSEGRSNGDIKVPSVDGEDSKKLQQVRLRRSSFSAMDAFGMNIMLN